MSGASQSRGPRKSDTITTTPAGLRVAPTRVRARAADVRPPPSSGGSCEIGPDQAEHPAATTGGRQDGLATGPEGHDPEAVAATSGEATDDERGAFGDVRLAAVRRPEVHRRGVVQQEPRGQLAVRHVFADLGLGGAGGGVPVDAADVVARFVRPDPVQFDAGAAAATQVVAAHLTADTAGHRELQLTDEALGDGAGPGSSRGAFPPAEPSRDRRRRRAGRLRSRGRLHRHLEPRSRDER